MDTSIRNRLLTILFVFGLGIYALLPTLRYAIMDEEKKSNLSDEQIDHFESRSIKQGLDLKGGIYIVLEVDLPQLIDNLAKNKDNNFNEFLIDLKSENERLRKELELYKKKELDVEFLRNQNTNLKKILESEETRILPIVALLPEGNMEPTTTIFLRFERFDGVFGYSWDEESSKIAIDMASP